MMGIKDSNQLLISNECNIVTLHGNMVANQDSSDKKIIKCFVNIWLSCLCIRRKFIVLSLHIMQIALEKSGGTIY